MRRTRGSETDYTTAKIPFFFFYNGRVANEFCALVLAKQAFPITGGSEISSAG